LNHFCITIFKIKENPMGKLKAAHHEEIIKGQQESALKATRWFRANNKADKLKGAEVDRENGAIYGIACCTEGEALGHRVWLDGSFITALVKLGKAQKMGVKARFGHPNMSGEALGTYVGRFQNFRQEGTKAIADLYFDDSAKVSPNGDLADYLMTLAETSPDMFGASIVFSIGGYYFKKTSGDSIKTSDHYRNQEEGKVDYQLELDDYGDAKYYVSIKELYGTDLVDEPAANPSGLFSQFSSTNLHADKFAVIATSFLNQNPHIAAFVEKNPHKITEFMAKFNANKKADHPIDDDDDAADDLLLGEEDAPIGEAADDAPPVADEEALLSIVEARFAARFKAHDDTIEALQKRVKDLEESPNADPTFNTPKKDQERGKEKPVYSWDKEAEKRSK
jgi:hypothetical protein